jgi:hypothetical protein
MATLLHRYGHDAPFALHHDGRGICRLPHTQRRLAAANMPGIGDSDVGEKCAPMPGMACANAHGAACLPGVDLRS